MICLGIGINRLFIVHHPNRPNRSVKSKPNPNFHSQISSSRVFYSNIHLKTEVVIVDTVNPVPDSMAKSDSAGEIMLTSGASGRVTALLSLNVLKSFLMLVNAFFLLIFFPFRGRKRFHSPAMPSPEKGGKEEICGANSNINVNRKGGVPVMRVPSRIVPWKSSASAAAAVAVDQEVAVRRAIAIRKVTDGGWDYSLFVTPRGETMFTQSWTPVSLKTRAVVVLLHGLNEHWYDEFAKQLNAHAYKVYGMDWVGHGGSDGLHAYVHSLDDAVTDTKAFILHVLAENPGLPCFCFGHSTGGAIILKAVLDPKVEKSIAGVVLTSPAVGVQPSHPIFLILAPVFSLLLPKFQFSAANKKGTPVSRDPAALQNSRKLKVPFFVLHGTADTVTDPEASLKLYEEASSEDKSIKLLPGYLHDLLFEPEREEIKRDIIECSALFATPDAGVSSETTVWAMQDFYSLRKEVEAISKRVEEIRDSADLEQLGEEVGKLEKAAASDSLWDDRSSAQQTLMALTDVKDKINLLNEFQTQVDDAETIVNLTEEMESTDTALLEEAATIVKELNKALDKFELSQLLSGPYDKEGAVINITAGAGGTDAQDWADMLLRMYVRWGERQRYKTRVVEKSMGEEAGIKSATVEVEGRYAFGYLSGEKGTHRIVRQSPFNSKGLRQTSFSGVEVMPLLPEDSLNVEIPEEDLQIGFSRAGGSGGQNVNKVETAVRITHIPTGVTVRCTEERSQLANKIKAMSRLKAKLLVIAVEQRASEIKQIRGDAVKADWGQQIRNYVFHPYKLVKDVRTGHETTDIVSVMDGELDPFIKAYLRFKYTQSM
ncbi:hypothetical protein SSX86_016961 [Deinandra increscens subsp. villosa]|uniref:Prokaryotic-type class I peptide chain release factors domain-containing protein n=1 Tax=Deinandra increscens subsp. villosa TaxID=3103831 RepID=A0AAP0GV96_9ASTR